MSAIQKSPISILQEIFQQNGKPSPVYQEVPTDLLLYPFKCNVMFGNLSASGYAHTKKEAKQNCAQQALEQLGITQTSVYSIINNNNCSINKNISTAVSTARLINYVGLLNEHASTKGVGYPFYRDDVPKNGQFVVKCTFLNRETEGKGTVKKSAKQDAAKKMLEQIKTEDIDYEYYRPHYDANNDEKDAAFDLLLKNYNDLTLYKDHPIPTVPDYLLPKTEIGKETDTINKLMEKLEDRGHECELRVFQRNPYIMQLNIDNSACLMGHGETKDSATQDLFETCKIMLEGNFSFKIGFGA